MYYNKAIFNYYYKIGAAEGITEDNVRDFYIENYARVEYIPFYFENAGGETLIGDAKQQVRDRANEYYGKVKDGMKIDEARSAFQSVSSAEVSVYVSSSISQSEADAATETDPETGQTIGTSAPTTTEAATTTPAETTAATTPAVTASATAADNGGVTTTAAATAESETETETETTTTTVPYANETIIESATTSKPADIVIEIEGGVTTTAAEPYYQPNKPVNEAVFKMEDDGKPVLVEADDAMYLIVRYDIAERMNADDLWTEDKIEEITIQAYQETFFDRIKEWSKTIDVDENAAAFRRYKIWNFKISSGV